MEDLAYDDASEFEERRITQLKDANIDEDAVLKDAKESLMLWQGYFNDNITRGKEDANFVLRDQWTSIERNEFTRLFKPAMTFNKLYDPIKKILGEQRKNKPDLLVRSLTGKATQSQIDLISDLVRSISYQSQNDLVYQTAFRSALTMGYGAFQVCVDYETPLSFNQVIRYDIITDPTRCAWDPKALMPHKGDGNFCMRLYSYSEEEFYATYPYVQNAVSYTDPRSLIDFQWQTKGMIVVADFYRKEWHPLTILKLSDGNVVSEEEYEDIKKEFKKNKAIFDQSPIVGDMIKNEMPTIVSKRLTQDYRVMHYRLIHNQIIDFREWPSKHLPIIFVDGDSFYIEGKQYTRSFCYDAKDAQRFVNYVGSEAAAEIKNRRREQWIGTPDNIIGYEQIWRNPELQAGILLSKPDPKTGQLPQKLPPWELSQSILTQYQRGTQDIREILGFSEVEQLQGRDISGKARKERKIEGSMSAYIFFDNSNQAFAQGGRVSLDLLPYVYGNDERYVNISKKDGSTQSVILNQKMPDGTIKNQLEKGDYDIEIDTGPSFAVQKEVALEFLQQTLQAYPQAFPLIADLWAKNLDVQFMPQMVERFKSIVPPDILAKEQGMPPPPPPPPSPEQQMMQLEMQNQTHQIEERAQELKIRQEKHELEKIELALKARELQEKLSTNRADKAVELHKSNLDYISRLAKIEADLHMNRNKKQTE